MEKIMKSISLILVMALLLAMPVSANGGVSPLSSAFIESYSVSLEQCADSAFKIWFEVSTVYGLADDVGADEIEIQRSSDGQNWETIKTCTPSRYASMLGHDTAAYANYVIHAGTQGYYYRAYVTIVVADSRGAGYATAYTETLYLQPTGN